MKHWLLIALVFFVCFSAFSYVDTLDSLQPFVWKNRILVVSSDQPTNRLDNLLAESSSELADRDLVLIVLSDSDYASTHPHEFSSTLLMKLRNLLRHSDSDYLLFGKDGGPKRCADTFDLEKVFACIDAMPMRLREMRRKR